MRGHESGEAAAGLGVRDLQVPSEHGVDVALFAQLLGRGDAQFLLTHTLHQRVGGTELEHLGAGLCGQDLFREPVGSELVQRAFGVFHGEHDQTQTAQRSQVESCRYGDRGRTGGAAARGRRAQRQERHGPVHGCLHRKIPHEG